ncbi:MAG: SurA N-terminal domain-containing protein [Pseudomonadota bacterium]
MLKQMRENASSWIIKILFGFLVLTFVSWGGYSGIKGCGSKEGAIIVDKQVISQQEYKERYMRELERQKMMFPKAFSGEMPKYIEEMLKKNVLEQMTNEILLGEMAQKLGISISKEEVTNIIKNIDSFKNKETGQFDISLYKRLLQYNSLTPQEFEGQQMSLLERQRIINLFQGGIILTENEIKDAYESENHKVILSYLELDPNNFEYQGKLNDDELKSLYESSKTSFQLPEERKVKYIIFDTSENFDSASYEEDEAFTYFEEKIKENVESKWQKKLSLVSRIFVKTAEDEAARTNEILGLLNSGEDFHKVAVQSSDDYYAGNGGRLGYLTDDDIKLKFTQEALPIVNATKINTYSKPIKTSRGTYIVLVEDKINAGDVSFARLKNVVDYDLKLQIASENIQLIAEEASELIKMPEETLEAYAKKNKMKIFESSYFSKESSNDRIFQAKPIISKLFTLSKEDSSEALKIKADLFVIAQIADIKAPIIPEFDIAKDMVKKELIKNKSQQMASDKAEELVKELANNKPFEDILKENKLIAKDSTEFGQSENGYIPGLGKADDLMKLAFATDEGAAIKKSFLINNKYVIAKVKKVSKPDWAKFESEKEEISTRLTSSRKNLIVSSWLKSLNDEADIKVNIDI